MSEERRQHHEEPAEAPNAAESSPAHPHTSRDHMDVTEFGSLDRPVFDFGRRLAWRAEGE